MIGKTAQTRTEQTTESVTDRPFHLSHLTPPRRATTAPAASLVEYVLFNAVRVKGS